MQELSFSHFNLFQTGVYYKISNVFALFLRIEELATMKLKYYAVKSYVDKFGKPKNTTVVPDDLDFGFKRKMLMTNSMIQMLRVILILSMRSSMLLMGIEILRTSKRRTLARPEPCDVKLQYKNVRPQLCPFLYIYTDIYMGIPRISVLSPCMLRIDFCCVVSVTVGGAVCSDDGQDIELFQIFCRIRCKSDARSRRVEKLGSHNSIFDC